MDAVTGDDLVSDVATYLDMDRHGDERAWSTFTALRMHYDVEEADGRYRLSAEDDDTGVLVGAPALSTLTAVYNQEFDGEGMDRAVGRWGDETREDASAPDKIAEEVRDEVVSLLDQHYYEFSVGERFVYSDGEDVLVVEEGGDRAEPVDSPREEVALDELLDYYDMARDMGGREASAAILGIVRDLYRVAEGESAEIYHDPIRDETVLFDREHIDLRRVDGVDRLPVAFPPEPDPEPTVPEDATLFEDLFDPETFGD